MRTLVVLCVLLGASIAVQSAPLEKKKCQVQLIEKQVKQLIADGTAVYQQVGDDVDDLISSVAECILDYPLKIVSCIVGAVETEGATVQSQVQQFITKETPLIQKLVGEVEKCLG